MRLTSSAARYGLDSEAYLRWLLTLDPASAKTAVPPPVTAPAETASVP
ncbi:hypothetical protein [Leifsonia xyli]|nr:hypothetical protein [Leifsonia xyli]